MSKFNIVNVIEAKSQGKVLSHDEIEGFIGSVYDKSVDEAQIGAFLMAVKIKGMNPQETADLTNSMVKYSDKFNWSSYSWKGNVVDKHSTGGVGDKLSHILAPILAACGLKIPMISGRGLGITGGTIDKLEAIKGFSPTMKNEELIKCLEDSGLFIIGQTENMVPVDKCLYAIRDITATIDSIPLITASILCKKKIEDLQMLLMDIKYGKGAFMKTIEEAEKLAKSMIDTGKSMNMKVVCLIDNMDSPLGYCVGNALEMAEVFRSLNGEISSDVKEIITVMVYQMMKAVNASVTEKEIPAIINGVIDNGTALEHLTKMLLSQGVQKELATQLCQKKLKTIEEYLSLMNQRSKMETGFVPEQEGYIINIDSEIIGELVRDLKGGRLRKDDTIDFTVGVQLYSKEGEKVKKKEPWAKVFHSEALTESTIRRMKSAITISKDKPETKTRIAKVLN